MFEGVLLAIAALTVVSGGAATPANGEIVSSAACVRQPDTYDAYVAAALKQYQAEAVQAAKFGITPPPAMGLPGALATRAEYEGWIAHPTSCRRILYGSDGLRVVAYVWEPPHIAPGVKLPVILALHGGNRNEAKWKPDSASGMARLVAAGFIVVGVQYRGVDGGEGQEQFGGDDVHDVVNAVTLARELPEADTRNVFLMGASRGGMMVYLALRDGAKVNAAATISGLIDLELEAKRHPDWEAQNWRPLIPNYDRDRAAALAQRSGVLVAKTVDLPPMLILHGTADWRVDPRDSYEAAEALQARERPYELHVFEGDVHGLVWNSRERDTLMISWFRKYMVK
jgi:dipeptidyl aminopeptidase/acylaminoacyl peptidase